MGNLQTSHNQILRIWNTFRNAWNTTSESWKDKDRDQFEHEHIQEFSDATNKYIANLSKLVDAIQQIQRDAP